MRHSVTGRLASLAASAALLTLAALPAQAATWVPLQGNVRTGNGAAVCALVLANGQYMFSCDGNGTYSLNVPLDDQGQVTLFAFADGFAPFRVTLGPSGFPYTVQMEAATSDSEADSIVGAWQVIDPNEPNSSEFQVAVFRADGIFAIAFEYSCNADGIEYTGMETGTYSYDAANKSLTITSATTDDNAFCGFADSGQPYDFSGWQFAREGDHLRVDDPDGVSVVWPKL